MRVRPYEALAGDRVGKATRPTTMLAAVLVAAVLVAACADGDTEPVNGEAGAAAEPTCEDIRAFADQLVDVAFDVDYEPSSGPIELAAWADVVLSGHLTGEVTTQGEFIGYELAEVEVLAGAADDLEDDLDDGTATVAVAYTPTYEPAQTYADAIPPGAPVIAFADVAETVPGGLVARLPEGFMTGCDGLPPVGWVELHSAWAQLGSLDDVAALVSGSTNGTEPGG